MADPYANLSNTFQDLTRNLIALKGQQMQQALSEAELGMRGRQFDEQARVNQIQHGVGLPGQPGYIPGTDQRMIDLKERELNQANNKAKTHEANFGSIEAKKTTNILTTFGVKKDNPFISEIEAIGKDNSINNARAYQYFKSAYPQYRESLIENMADDFVKKSQKPGWENTPEAQKQKDFINALEYDETGDNILNHAFADTIKSMRDEELNSKLTIMQATSAERASLANPETKFMVNKERQYVAAGMNPADAAVKAYEDLSVIKARQAREGRVNVSLNAPTNDQVATLVKGVLDGTIDPNGISKRGGLQAAVWSGVKQADPAFDIVKAGAGAKFQQATGTMQTKALLNTIDPLLTKLEETGAVLGNSSVPLYNKAKNFLKEQKGSDDIVGFNNLRDDVIAEVERGLMGTGVLSDNKYQRALKNVNSAQSYPQLQAAVKNMRIVIQARLDAINAGPNATAGATPAPPNPGRRSTDKPDPLGIRR